MSGVLFVLYPVVSSYITERQQEKIIAGYENAVSKANDEQIRKEWEKAITYNMNGDNYVGTLNLNGNGVIGYLEIPKIDIRIPVYHYVSDETLKKGVGHVEHTELPVGEEYNHCVITGYHGFPNTKMFTQLDELKTGELFYLHILDKVFAYEVNRISIILPEKMSDIGKENTKDKEAVTLVTCTPYGMDKHYFLVTGEQTEFDEIVYKEQVTKKTIRNKNIVKIIILFTAMVFFLYPHAINKIYEFKIEKRKRIFAEKKAEMGAQYKLLYQELIRRNELLYEMKQEDFSSLNVCEEASVNLRLYGISNHIIGYISIPKIKTELPVYLGAGESNMKQGAVHLTETSYPIGGVNTNCVIAAHRGYRKIAMFREIDKLEKGDIVYIDNFREQLCYKVSEIRIISPEDVQKLLIQEGKDLVTLMTCHPYKKNFQRYVVFCERV